MPDVTVVTPPPVVVTVAGAPAIAVALTNGQGPAGAPAVAPIAALAIEAIPAGSVVHVFHDGVQVAMRLASAVGAGFEATHVVASAVTAGAVGQARGGVLAGLAGLVPGEQWLSTTPGSCAAAPPALGNFFQRIGFAPSASTLHFRPQPGFTTST